MGASRPPVGRVVVTGGSGFLGSHIADALTAAGHSVTLFDRRPSAFLQADQKMSLGDLLDPGALETAMAGADTVFHLAGLADINRAASDPLEAAEANIVGTVRALEAARRADVGRFLFASTIYVYSRAGGFYRASKQACEAYIEEYQRQFGLPYTILRYGSLYGPRADRTNGVLGLLRQALEGSRIRHVGHADDAREYVHVEDAARLSVQALDPAYENQHLVVTGAHPTRLRDLFTMFSEILGKPLDVEYAEPADRLYDTHYRMTPYAFNPRVGRKLTSNYTVDMGQGILQMLEQLHNEAVGEAAAAPGEEER